MDSGEITFNLCSIDDLAKKNDELRARLKAVEQNTVVLPPCAALTRS